MSSSTIRSMTGFGAANAEVDGSKYAVEVRSVNNKFLKTIVRLPDELVALETDLETNLFCLVVSHPPRFPFLLVSLSSRQKLKLLSFFLLSHDHHHHPHRPR